MKETELYAPVKDWLESQGYTVYPEVECRGSRADVVGVKENSTVIVELKTSLSLELIGQGAYWVDSRSANKVYLAIPMPVNKLHWYAVKLVNREGLGLLLVPRPGMGHSYYPQYGIKNVLEHTSPKLIGQLSDKSDISKCVNQAHLDFGIEGGHSGGGYVTPYKITMLNVKKYLMEDRLGGWALMEHILDNCKHHYRGANPGKSLGNALEKFESDWCETTIISGKKYFRAKVMKK